MFSLGDILYFTLKIPMFAGSGSKINTVLDPEVKKVLDRTGFKTLLYMVDVTVLYILFFWQNVYFYRGMGEHTVFKINVMHE